MTLKFIRRLGCLLFLPTVLLAAPVNDNFVDRIPIMSLLTLTTATNTFIRAAVMGSNQEASSEPGETNRVGSQTTGGLSVWWSWTAPSNGWARVWVTDFSAFSSGAVAGVFVGSSISNLSLVAASGPSYQGWQSFYAVAGTTYAVMVDASYTPVPDDHFWLNLEQIVSPPNDNFADRIQLAGDRAEVDGYGFASSGEPGEPYHAGTVPSESVWWSWTAPTNGFTKVSILPNGPFLRVAGELAVYTGDSLTNLVEISSTTALLGQPVSTTFQAIAGTSYSVALDPAGPYNRFTLRVSMNNPPTVILIRPSADLTLSPGTNLVVEATATDLDGTIAKVDLLASGTLIQTATEPPYTGILSNLNYGRFPLVARATDAEGETSYSAAVIVRVPPPNDDFTNGFVLDGFPTDTRGTNGGTSEPGEPLHAGQIGHGSAWWSWTALTSGPVVAAVSGASRAIVAVYTGDALSNLVLVSSNYNPSLLVNNIAASFVAVAGTIYHIAIDSLASTGGPVNLHLLPPSTNDLFDGPALLQGERVSASGHNLSATVEPGEPPHSVFQSVGSKRSIWWTWIAPRADRFTVATAGSTFRTLLAVYTGDSVTNLQLIARDGDSYSPGHFSRISFDAARGQTYRIAVDGIHGDAGLAQLAITPSSRPHLQAMIDTDGAAVLVIDGEAGRSIELQASTNLVHWESLGAWLNTNTSLQFTDGKPANFQQRFFRAVTLP